MSRAKPVASARWTAPAELTECLAALQLSARHEVLAKRGFDLVEVEAKLSDAGRLTVRVVWDRAMQPAGEGLLARARRHRRLVDKLVVDLPFHRALFVQQRLQSRGHLSEMAEASAFQTSEDTA
jgi:hypothetical protein